MREIKIEPAIPTVFEKKTNMADQRQWPGAVPIPKWFMGRFGIAAAPRSL
jgi:hypothetical protein